MTFKLELNTQETQIPWKMCWEVSTASQQSVSNRPLLMSQTRTLPCEAGRGNKEGGLILSFILVSFFSKRPLHKWLFLGRIWINFMYSLGFFFYYYNIGKKRKKCKRKPFCGEQEIQSLKNQGLTIFDGSESWLRSWF